MPVRLLAHHCQSVVRLAGAAPAPTSFTVELRLSADQNLTGWGSRNFDPEATAARNFGGYRGPVDSRVWVMDEGRGSFSSRLWVFHR